MGRNQPNAEDDYERMVADMGRPHEDITGFMVGRLFYVLRPRQGVLANTERRKGKIKVRWKHRPLEFGTVVKVTMCSRMGDVGIADWGQREGGYSWRELPEWLHPAEDELLPMWDTWLGLYRLTDLLCGLTDDDELRGKHWDSLWEWYIDALDEHGIVLNGVADTYYPWLADQWSRSKFNKLRHVGHGRE